MRTRALLLLLTFVFALTAAAASKRHAASPDRCTSSVSPASLSFPATGGHATVNVAVTGGCSWSPVASDAWIAAGPSGNQISVDVGANSAQTTRNGLIHVRGVVVVVTQAANSIPNLLNNGGFDSGTSSWSNAFSAGGSATWGNPSVIVAPPTASTGAVMITSTDPGKGYQLSQCFAVTGGKSYEMGTKVLIPAGQPFGVINFAAYEFWVPNCDVSTNYHQHTELSSSSPIGTWFDKTITQNTDFSTKSILVVIGAGGSPNPPFSAWFDDVYARPK
jgi:hypothetical protein